MFHNLKNGWSAIVAVLLTGSVSLGFATGDAHLARANSDVLAAMEIHMIQGASKSGHQTASEGQPKKEQAVPNATQPTPPLPADKQGGYVPLVPGQKYGDLRVKVIDGRTMKPISGAEVVVIETEKRYRTGNDGLTPWIKAPVLRSARFRFLVNELHGQLTLISYKNGYRDSVHMGVRMNENAPTKTTIWQYKIDPAEDRRVEPVLYEEPYHRLWLIQLADRFRRPSQLGEGYERP